MSARSSGDGPGDGTRPGGGETAKQAGAYFEWGVAGARVLARSCALVVVVDVLSFTTTVAVATAMGAEVFPSGDEEAGRRLAALTSSRLAVGRHEVDTDHLWSLSPADVAAAPPVPRLVLPSPNGGAISAALGESGTPVVAACLRNEDAVVAWLREGGFGTPERPVAVVASGERWRDGSLRPAIEDLLASGLVLAGLGAAGVPLSVDASVAARSVAGLAPSQLADLVRASRSGEELRVAGYGEDVEIAVGIDAEVVVPVMAGTLPAFRSGLKGGDLR